jgi:hypothetical protein
MNTAGAHELGYASVAIVGALLDRRSGNVAVLTPFTSRSPFNVVMASSKMAAASPLEMTLLMTRPLPAARSAEENPTPACRRGYARLDSNEGGHGKRNQG